MRTFLSIFFAILISGPITYFIDFHWLSPHINSQNITNPDASDYSPTYENLAFDMTLSIYLIYIFIGIPVTLLVDLFMTRYTYSYFKKYIIQILLYFILILIFSLGSDGEYIRIDVIMYFSLYVYVYFHLLFLFRLLLKDDI